MLAAPTSAIARSTNRPHVQGFPYRADIDGLRAVAVLSVFAFHLGLLRFAGGGFLGVDIFFVISGYLITQIIAHEIRISKFGIANFYRRRALRILPALIAMLILVIAASLFILPPIEIIALGKRVIGADFSVSNIQFYLSPNGYFFDDFNARPLLHTWSLGVEEQFYLIFPMLLIAAHKFMRKRLIPAVIILGLSSFAISIWSLRTDPNGAFFLLPSRFWELMLGSAIALSVIPFPKNRMLAELFAAVGLSLVLLSVTTTNENNLTLYWAIGPCLGTALLILSGQSQQTYVARLLSFRPIVWIGLISYSLYLWHWPIIVLSRIGLGMQFTLEVRVAIIAISFALAIISWYVIERPFRQTSKMVPNSIVFAGGGAAVVTTALIGLCLIYYVGFPSRFSADANRISGYLNPVEINALKATDCFITAPNQHFDWNACLGSETKKGRVILFGDSHAADLLAGLSHKLQRDNLREVTATYCRPLISIYSKGLPFCADIVGQFFRTYLQSRHDRDTIIISERWSPDELPAIRDTLTRLRETGARVILVGPIPEYITALPRLEFLSVVWNRPSLVNASLAQGFRAQDLALKRMSALEHIHYVSLVDEFCNASQCRAYVSHDVPLLFDTDHLTTEGSIFVSSLLVAAINQNATYKRQPNI